MEAVEPVFCPIFTRRERYLLRDDIKNFPSLSLLIDCHLLCSILLVISIFILAFNLFSGSGFLIHRLSGMYYILSTILTDRFRVHDFNQPRSERIPFRDYSGILQIGKYLLYYAIDGTINDVPSI